MNMILRLLICVVGLSFCFTGNVLADSCSAITGDERGSPTGDRIRKANAAVFSELGLTKVLTRFEDPGRCWDRGEISGKFKFKKTDLCLRFEDYGVGSFDPLKHNYCQHNLYILQLHDESPAVRRVIKYVYTDTKGETIIDVIGEFDEKGNKVSGSSARADKQGDESGGPDYRNKESSCENFDTSGHANLLKTMPADVCAVAIGGRTSYGCDEDSNPYDRMPLKSVCFRFSSETMKFRSVYERDVTDGTNRMGSSKIILVAKKNSKTGAWEEHHDIWATGENTAVTWMSSEAKKLYASNGGDPEQIVVIKENAPSQEGAKQAETPTDCSKMSILDRVRCNINNKLLGR